MSYYSNKRGGWQLKADVTYSQNKSGNYSDVTIKLVLVADPTWRINASTMSGTTNINGSSAGFSANPSTAGGNSVPLTTRTVKVPHNADGTKTVSFSFSYALNIYSGSLGGNVGTLSGSGSLGLTKIPRAFDFIMSSSKANIGDNFTIKVNDNGSGYKPWAYVSFGNKRLDLKEVPIGSDKDFTLDIETLAPAIPQSATGWGNVCVDTWTSNASNATLIGTVSKRIDLTLPSSKASPTIDSFTTSEAVEKVKAVTGGGQYLQNQSSVAFTVKGTTLYGASISSTQVLYGGKTLPVIGGLATLELSKTDVGTGEKTATAKIVDSRGFSVTKDVKFTVLPYSPPVISLFSASRKPKADASVVTKDDILVSKKGTVSPVEISGANKNTYTALTEYRLVNTEAWTSGKKETNAFADYTIADTDVKKSYEIRVTLTDQFASATATVAVSTAQYPLSFYRGVAVGVAKLYEPGHGALDVGGDIWMNGRSLLDTFYPIGSIYQSVNSSNPSTFMGGTWERFGNGTVLVGVNESDTDFATAEKTGGKKSTALRAHIGAWNSSPSYLSYYATSPVPGQGHNFLFKGLSTAPVSEFNNQNHSTIVTDSQGKDLVMYQPYTTVYMWKRTA